MSSGHDHKHHILPLSIYYGVAGALFVLTIITVAVAQYDFGSMNIIVAMAVAALKASLVALFFMHLKYDNKLYASFFVGSLVFLATFIVFTMFDTETRGRIYEDVNSPINQRAVIYNEDGAPLKANSHGEHSEEAGTAGHMDDAAATGEGEAAVDDQGSATGNATDDTTTSTEGGSAATGDHTGEPSATGGH
ncbi:cytochrome C oxidase subunit IV family protein [bacterium]|nr:cytochrome C oxidase subunit IV family protein [bacterium]